MKNKDAIIILKDIQRDIMPHDELSGQRTEDVAFNLAIKALENQPRWIPVSKKIPETHGYYLTSTIYNQVYCDYWNGDCFDRTETVLAWMPLPEPYKREETT